MRTSENPYLLGTPVNRGPGAYSTSDRYSTNTLAMFKLWWFCTYRRLSNSSRDSSLRMATNRILPSAREPPIYLSAA
jgi:hypothetical protein